MSTHWTIDDYTADRCAFEQVGRERSPEQVLELPPDDPDLTASAQLKRDAMLTYKALGGPQYLRRNPELLDKALLKMMAEPVQKVDATIKIVIDAPWMDGRTRLSYPGGPNDPRRGQVADGTPVELLPQRTLQPEEGLLLLAPSVAGELLPAHVSAADATTPEPDGIP